MILLRRHSEFGTIASLDEVSGDWSEILHGINGDSQDTDGLYEVISGKLCAIFRSNHKLHIRIDDKQIELTNSVKIAVSGPSSKRLLSISESGTPVIAIEYEARQPRDEDDLTPFIEPEDFDFGLMLSEIAKSPSRQRVLKGLDDVN